MTDKIVLVTTCDSAAEAEKIASALVESRLAACVNILPAVSSVYRWKGSIDRASEIILLVKTGRPLLRRVQAEIERLHSYELPEMIALQIVDGSERYLDWLAQGLTAMDEEEER